MIDWFKIWSKEIVITVIIVTLVEIIAPNNNIKKYIKIATGLVIMYAVLYPIFSNLLSFDISVDNFSLENNSKTVQCMSENIVSNMYIKNLEKDICSRLQELGYEVQVTSISVNENTYEIEKIQIKVNSKDSSKKKAYSIVKTIKHICISISDDEKNGSIIDEEERIEIVEFISDTYGVCNENIEIK